MKTAAFLRLTPYLVSSFFVFALAARPLLARQPPGQQDSVAEAARRAREEKKKAAKEPKKVITDDNLKPASPETVTSATAEVPRIPGSTADQAKGKEEGAGAAKAARPEDASKAAQELAKAEADLAQLKQQLAIAEKDLNIAQREFALDRQTHYSNPDYQHDAAGKAKLDDLDNQISSKKQEVDTLKSKFAAQQELVKRLKGSAPASAAGRESKPPSPQP